MASAFDNRVFFFRLSFSIIGHFETSYETLTKLRHRPDFCEISFPALDEKQTNTVRKLRSLHRGERRPHLFPLSDKYVSTELFSHNVDSFYEGFYTRALLIKLFVFVRFCKRYREQSTRKDIKARFALRNTNGFREFSPTRSYRLSRHRRVRRPRSDSTCHRSSI